MKDSTSETENPFTMNGLFTAIIDDFNDLRQKIDFLKEQIVLLNNKNLSDKGNIETEDFQSG